MVGAILNALCGDCLKNLAHQGTTVNVTGNGNVNDIDDKKIYEWYHIQLM